MPAIIERMVKPSIWAEAELGIRLDPWQKTALDCTSRFQLWNCSRQSGKSLMLAVRALHQAAEFSNSLALILSASMRQATETFHKVLSLYRTMDNPPERLDDSSSVMTLKNGSRILVLPGSEGTVRGYSAPDVIMLDEAAHIPDALYYAIRPMLVTSGGQLILSSSPFAKLGFFWEVWKARKQAPEWWWCEVPWTDCPRIDETMIEADRRAMSREVFDREYNCQFMDVVGGLFSSEDLEAMRFRTSANFDISPWKLPDIEGESKPDRIREALTARGVGRPL